MFLDDEALNYKALDIQAGDLDRVDDESGGRK